MEGAGAPRPARTAPIVVLCALPVERRAVGRVRRPDVVLGVSGMGAAAAERAADGLLAASARALVAVGFCGALDPALRVGELVAAERVIDARDGSEFAADAGLLAAAPGRRAILASAGGIARTFEQRRLLPGAVVDLESAAAGRAAERAGVPFLALRAVTDTARQQLPDLDAIVDASGRLAGLPAVGRLARRPSELARLARLSWGALLAGRALGAGVRTMTERLP